jgi:hypothetical protein
VKNFKDTFSFLLKMAQWKILYSREKGVQNGTELIPATTVKPPTSDNNNGIFIAIIITVAVFFVFLIFAGIYCFCFKKKKQIPQQTANEKSFWLVKDTVENIHIADEKVFRATPEMGKEVTFVLVFIRFLI